MGALFKQAGDFVACIILSETFDLLFFPKNKIYLCSFSIMKLMLEWVKCLKFLRINETEIADGSAQNKVIECDQLFIHMTN